jgi:dephospho-CoA kinase
MASQSRTNSDSRRPRGRWKHGPIPVVGLTGEIGAGKSAVAALLAERGAFVLDADAIGHALLNQRPARDRVVARFGPKVLVDGPEPTIDRRALGALVFADPAKRKALETILHPRMRGTFERAIRRTVRKAETPVIVLDAAILLEAGWNSLCDLVLYVAAPREQRLARLGEQRGWTEEVLAARERAQWPSAKKRAAADAVIDNDGTPDSLRAATDQFWTTTINAPRRRTRGTEASPAGRQPGPARPRNALRKSSAPRRTR